MVKPDYTRDYYADLGLSPSADINDIKKQYRQLALKYHPDRNPGQEEQAKERFVIIQVAHELLSDPATKSKYDANRRPPASGATGSGVRGNPYSGVSRDMSDRFGAPPTRPTRQPPTPYSNWGVPKNSPQPKPAGNPFDHLRAWDRMRSSSSKSVPKATASGPSPSPGKAPTKPAAQPPPPPPRTAYQARQQEASFGTPRRTGFAPADPMADEAQVPNHNYKSYNSNLFAETAANLRKQQAQPRPASAHAERPSEDYDEVFVDARQRTPYASNLGEKTNPFEGASTTRAKSVRESWRKGQEEAPEKTPPRPARQRSASVGEQEGFPKPATAEKAPQSRFDGGFEKPPTTRFASQAGERYSPRPPTDPKPPPRPPKVPESGDSREAPTSSTATNGTAPSKKPKVYDSPFYTVHSTLPKPSKLPFYIPHLHPSFSSVNPKPGKEADGSSSGGQARGARIRDPAAPSGAAASNKGVSRLEQLFNSQFDVLLGSSKASHLTTPVPTVPLQQVQPQRSYSQTNSPFAASFTVPDDDDDDVPELQTPKTNPASQQARFMRNSTESINTRFVADGKPSKNYEFNAGGLSPNRDPLRTDPFLRAKQRSRSTPRGQAASKADEPASPSVPANPPQLQEVPKVSAFDAGQWQQEFGPHTFVPAPVSRQASSPTRPTRAAKKPKAPRMPTGAANVVDLTQSSDDEGPEPAHTDADLRGDRSPNAMDIDPPSFQASTPTGGARTIHVEPSKPEWRPGHVNGVTPEPATAGDASAQPPKPPKVESKEPPIFKDMFNVAPFAAPKPAGVGGAGLGGFGDMKLNLPFPSQAASTKPTSNNLKDKSKEEFISRQFKDAPTCPQVPAALDITHLTEKTVQDWAQYAQNFHQYLHDWTSYENRIVEHFLARKRVREQMGDKTFNWVKLRGESGIRKYRLELETDKMVRRKWDLLSEEHEKRVNEFAQAHARIERLLPVPA